MHYFFLRWGSNSQLFQFFFPVSSWGCSVERCALLGFCWGAWLVCHACGSFNFCCGAMASLGVDCGRIIFVNGPLGWAQENDDSIFYWERERAIYISNCHEWWVKWVFEDHDFVRFVNIKSRILRHPSVHNLVLRWGEDQECIFFVWREIAASFQQQVSEWILDASNF